MKYGIPPGVFDIVPKDEKELWRSSYLWQYVEDVIRKIAKQYGFQEIRTPLFEKTELFLRGVGETTDIVSKEMYTFEDKGGRSLTLRPEGTAPVMRALLENRLEQASQVQKLFYICPMFRYERAQAGRYRQHHQFGVEAVGNASPEQDAEVIDMLYTLYRRLGLQNLTLCLNSIGDVESRLAFREALKEYLKGSFDQLSSDSQSRFETNPLRILDSKDPNDQKIVSQAPSILDYLNEESREHFQQLQELLTMIGIPFQINTKLVRGLDYYNKTVFEFVAGELGAQNSIGGGGRYDGLLKQLDGPDLPAFGFGAGIERILLTMLKQNVALPTPPQPDLFFIALGESARKRCFQLLHELRAAGADVQMDFSNRKLNKIMNYANHIAARFVAVVGDQELECGEVDLKNMATGEKQKASLTELARLLKD